MISLTVVILSLLLVFGGFYLTYRMNKTESLHKGPHAHRPRKL